jgi:NAD(P)-dependent dehydrogenase (short-subunit alcohol dehydrogenase family)
VIGGSSGIGLETARLARGEGAQVIFTADYSGNEKPTELDVNIPSYASAIVTTNQIVEALASVETLGSSAR